MSDLTAKRDGAIERLKQLEDMKRRVNIDIERTVGRITTLNELLKEQEEQPEAEGEPGE